MALHADAVWPRVLVGVILTGFLHLLNKHVVDTVIGKRFLQECKHNYLETELGNSAFVLNAQEMSTVVPGGLSNLVCCGTGGQAILWSCIGSVKDFISLNTERVQTE